MSKMHKIVFSNSFHNNQSRVMTKEESVIALEIFKYAQGAGRKYKESLLQSELGKKLQYGDMKKEKVYHLLGELRNAGEYLSREGWREGLLFGQACKNSRGGHNVKKDIEATQRILHRKALLMAGGVALNRSTWTAQTAYLRDTEEGQKALQEAEKLLKEAQQEA